MKETRKNLNLEIANLPNHALASHNLKIEPPKHNSNLSGKHEKLRVLREWKRIILQHKLLILSFIVLIVPIAAIQAYRAKPLYQATTTIEVRPETSSLSKNDGVLVVDSNDNTKAESFIIKSLPVMKRTVLDLNLVDNPRFLGVTANRSVLEAISALRGKPSVSNENPSGPTGKEGVEKSGKSDKNSASPAGDFVLDESREANTTRQDNRKRLGPYIDTLASNLRVDAVKDTRLIQITFIHTDPEIAAEVANGVAQSFISQSFERKTERFTSTSKWLGDATRKLKSQVEQAEQKLADYSRENNIFSLEGKESLTSEKLSRLHDQYMRAETDLLLKRSLYEEVKQGRVEQLPEAFADPKTADLQKTLNSMAIQASELSIKFGARHPQLQAIQQQMSTLKSQIDANRSTLEEKLKADYERALRDDQSLSEALSRAKSDAVQQNQASIQFSILQQDLATAKALYTDFLNKTSQTDIQRAEQFNNVRLVQEAEPPGSPFGPNRNQTIILGLVLSLILGLGLAYLIETFNTSIRTLEDVTRLTQLPVLAVIPSLTGAQPPGKQFTEYEQAKLTLEKANVALESRSGRLRDSRMPFEENAGSSAAPALESALRKFSAAAESYRMLRTSLLLSTAERPPKTILFTSGQPGDGKTTTVFNTAIALTQLKSEVLIVDCDMRKPRVHKLAQIPKGEGLSTYLTRGGELYKYIRRTPIPYLSILPCGYIPPNPSELISSEKMRELLRLLARGYEYVILDSPPVVAVADSIILSTLVDGVILVTRSRASNSELLQRASQDLTSVGAKILGVILNDLNMRHDGNQYYDQYSRHFTEHSSYGDTNSGIEAFR